MKVEGDLNWIVINHTANSLFSVIADGVPREKNAGRKVRNTWRSLMQESILENNCNIEGFNLQPKHAYESYVKVRIGLVANNQDDCNTCGSCIGFGTQIRSCEGYDLTSTSCGTSKAGCNGQSNKNKAAFGYILVR